MSANALRLWLLLPLLGLVLGCGQKDEPKGVEASWVGRLVAPTAGEKNPEYKFEEEVVHGDLRIQVLGVVREMIGEEGRGNYLRMTAAWVKVTNISDGKMSDWPGWQGQGEIKDEHGNAFGPVNVGRMTLNETADGGSRIAPGTTYCKPIYFEPMPATSKVAALTLPLNGRAITFSGPVTGEKEVTALLRKIYPGRK
jgi:hypothetical protein